MKKLNKAVELDYYIKEGISPVHYNLSNLKRHFDIRNSLYYLLGLPSKFLKNILKCIEETNCQKPYLDLYINGKINKNICNITRFCSKFIQKRNF